MQLRYPVFCTLILFSCFTARHTGLLIDPANNVEEPVRRLIRTLKESGAFRYGYARAMIVQLLETAVTYHQREHEINLYGKSSLTALNEWAAYPVGMRDRMLEENKTALDAVMNHPRLRDLFGKSVIGLE